MVHTSVHNDDYTKCSLDFPSDFVKQKVVDTLNAREYDWKSKPSILAGRLFEFIVGKHLLNWKGEMKVISLSNQSDLLITPPECSSYFPNAAVMTPQSTTALYLPIEPNKPSADFVYQGYIFQATIAKSHDVKAEGIIALSKQFGRKEWKLCFCILTIRLQNYTKPQTLNHQKKLADEEIQVTQYKLEIKD